MFCPNCGTQNPDGTSFCSNCGSPLTSNVNPAPAPAPVTPVTPVAPVAPAPAPAPVAPVAPVAPAPQPAPSYTPNQQPVTAIQPQTNGTNGLCLAGFIISLVSIVLGGSLSLISLILCIPSFSESAGTWMRPKEQEKDLNPLRGLPNTRRLPAELRGRLPKRRPERLLKRQPKRRQERQPKRLLQIHLQQSPRKVYTSHP